MHRLVVAAGRGIGRANSAASPFCSNKKPISWANRSSRRPGRGKDVRGRESLDGVTGRLLASGVGETSREGCCLNAVKSSLREYAAGVVGASAVLTSRLASHPVPNARLIALAWSTTRLRRNMFTSLASLQDAQPLTSSRTLPRRCIVARTNVRSSAPRQGSAPVRER